MSALEFFVIFKTIIVSQLVSDMRKETLEGIDIGNNYNYYW